MTTDASATRARLLALRAELETLCAAAANDRKPVALDPPTTDSIQMQAMAKAADARRAAEIRRINAALTRLDDGEYGYCATCGEAIAPRRLEVDPAAAQCAECAT